MKENSLNFNKRILLIILYFVFFLVQLIEVKYLFEEGHLIFIDNVHRYNVFDKAIQDSVIFILFLFIITPIFQPQNCWTFSKKNLSIIVSLFALYVILFVVNSDFSTRGVYIFLKYLFMVALLEELLFREILYKNMKQILNSKKYSILLSGLIVGLFHGIAPYVIYDHNIINSFFSELGGGILATWFFGYFSDKYENVLINILIHAILDYLKVFS